MFPRVLPRGRTGFGRKKRDQMRCCCRRLPQLGAVVDQVGQASLSVCVCVCVCVCVYLQQTDGLRVPAADRRSSQAPSTR